VAVVLWFACLYVLETVYQVGTVRRTPQRTIQEFLELTHCDVESLLCGSNLLVYAFLGRNCAIRTSEIVVILDVFDLSVRIAFVGKILCCGA